MPESKAARIAIASDQAIYLRGLSSLVMTMPGIQLVGEARSGAESQQLCQLTQPEIIILDFEYPLEQTRAIAAGIRQQYPQIKIILLLTAQAESQNQEFPAGCFSSPRR